MNLARSAPRPIGDVGVAIHGLDVRDAAGLDRQVALLHEAVELLGDGGRGAVAVNIPPAAGMPQEAPLFDERQPLPERRGGGAERIEHVLPGGAFGTRRLRLPPNPAQQLQHGSSLVVGERGQRPGCRGDVGPRQQAMARDGDDGPGKATRPELHGDVDRRQTGTEDDDRPARLEVLAQALAPGILEVASWRGHVRMQVADGKDRTGDAVTPPAGEREHVAFLRRFEIDHLVGDDAQAQRAVGAAKVVAQEAAEITPVEIARDEVPAALSRMWRPISATGACATSAASQRTK